MKRKIAIILFAIIIIVCSACVFVACNKNEEQQFADAISRITREYYAGESELFFVVIEKGEREKSFIADGKATDVQAFCSLSITPLRTNDYEELNFVIAGETATLSGSIKKSEYGEFVTDIQLDFVPISVTVTAGGESSEIELANVLDGALSAEDIINIAKTEFKETLDKEELAGKEREIYVKIITGDRTTYYYYVSFIGDGVDYLAMLVDPKTGTIISKK